MPFALSPGVQVTEKDFSSIIPAVSTSAGAVAGAFQWGPIEQPTQVSSEDVLVRRFGGPNDSNYRSFFSAANFLAYTNNLLVCRANASGLRNATSLTSGSVYAIAVDDENGTLNSGFKPGHNTTVEITAPDDENGVQATATVQFAGSSLTGVTITVSAGGSGYTEAPNVKISAPDIEGGEEATAVAVLDGDAVDTITIVEGGSGYFGPVTITITPADEVTGSGAEASLEVPTSAIDSIVITNAGSGYTSTPTATLSVENTESLGTPSKPNLVVSIVSQTGTLIKNIDEYVSSYQDLVTPIYGMFAARYAGTMGNGIRVILIDNAVWTYTKNNTSAPYRALILNSFSGAPGTSAQAAAKNISNDELHVLVLDSTDGKWTGNPDTILEKYEYISKMKGVTRADGTNVYYRDVIQASSEYIYAISTPLASQVADTQNEDWLVNVNTVASSTNLRDLNPAAVAITLLGGVDDYSVDLNGAYDKFLDSDRYDVSLLIAGDATTTVANNLISIAETRKDAVAFISPRGTNGPITGTSAVATITSYVSALSRTSYAVVDSGWKYQYDRYNDAYRWVPLNADIAGLCARTDYTNDPWFSPGGFNRGQVKNVVKLGYNPTKTERDTLYQMSVNPVVTFPGQGTVLFGDKTFLSKPSAFDRINVRRLFIVLEKAIATAAKFQLFEFNDDFTRAQFRNLVEPFLRTVQGRRGVTDFRVRCDATNNTGDVIDRNEFVASIFIKPNRSINFITLNFVAARSSVSFDEIGG